MSINELLEMISSTNVDDTKLFFITRSLKPGVKRKAKVIEKYQFRVFQVNNDDTLRKYIYDSTIEQLQTIADKNYEMVDYDVLNDDSESLFSFSTKNKVFSFHDVVANQLQQETPKVQNIYELENDKVKLWAYCVGFEDVENGEWVYTFRKMQASAVTVDRKDNGVYQKIRAFFNTESLMLEPLKGDTIVLDKQIDCVYFQDTFYVVKKFNFEQLVGLQEEYAEKAKIIASEMEQTEIFSGIDKLKTVIESKPSVHKKLVKIGILGTYKEVTSKDIKKMRQVCKQHGDILKVVDGRICMEEESDVDVVLKMFGDYYKQGEVSGKSYGTFSGKELKIQK